ncbi:MAG: hypothetical protein IIC01_08775 [Planctomycetes bacterium]|nr:hypothetical protein [Planctomycetota bacterium]
MSKEKTMKWIVLSMLAICQVTQAGEVVVGTFDSRAVAMAMARGETFKKKIVDMKAERDEAKAKGDKERVAELEKEGPALQERLHRQVFSNEPIDDVLNLIEKDLPGIAKAAGVNLLVSKWEIAYQDPDVKTIDVTWELVNLFQPDDQTKKLVKELLKTKPVPAEELKHDH